MGAEPEIERIQGVRHATTVVEGLYWIEDPAAPAALRVPFEVAHVSPAGFARFVHGSRERRLVGRLGLHQLIMSSTGASLRGARAGDRIVLDGRPYSIRGVVSDAAAQGYEALSSARPPAGWGNRFLLVRTGAKERLEAAVAELLGPPRPVAVVDRSQTPFLRYAHSVMPQAYFKSRLGEFAARPMADGTLAMDASWRRSHIVTRRIPLLGKVTCHRRLIGPLRRAMGALIRSGRERWVHRSGFAGCYYPRFIGRDPAGKLSSHSWGAAVDLNAPSNPLGARGAPNERLERLMRQNGFGWGGRWLVPDPMHFEWNASGLRSP